MAESIATLVRSGGEEVGVGAAAGAGLGSVVPGAGTLAGAATGAAAGTAMAGHNMELYASVMNGLEEKGVDISDPTALQAAFQNTALMEPIIKDANIRAAIIGGVDLVGGAAGPAAARALQSAKPLTKTGRVLQKLGKATTKLDEVATGSGGEAAAQLATTGTVNPQDVILEGIGEAPVVSTISTASRLAQATSPLKEAPTSLGGIPTIQAVGETVEQETLTDDGKNRIVKVESLEDVPVEKQQRVAVVDVDGKKEFWYTEPIETISVEEEAPTPQVNEILAAENQQENGEVDNLSGIPDTEQIVEDVDSERIGQPEVTETSAEAQEKPVVQEEVLETEETPVLSEEPELNEPLPIPENPIKSDEVVEAQEPVVAETPLNENTDETPIQSQEPIARADEEVPVDSRPDGSGIQESGTPDADEIQQPVPETPVSEAPAPEVKPQKESVGEKGKPEKKPKPSVKNFVDAKTKIIDGAELTTTEIEDYLPAFMAENGMSPKAKVKDIQSFFDGLMESDPTEIAMEGKDGEAVMSRKIASYVKSQQEAKSIKPKTQAEKIKEWTARTREEIKNSATSGGALYLPLLDAVDAAVDAAVKAGKTAKEINAAIKQAIEDFRSSYHANQRQDAEKAIAHFEKGAPVSVRRQLINKEAPTKKQVQASINKAFDIGFGFGEQAGETSGIKEGKKAAAASMKAALEGLKAQLSPQQITGILDRFAKVKDFSPESKQRFWDYAAKVVEDALVRPSS